MGIMAYGTWSVDYKPKDIVVINVSHNSHVIGIIRNKHYDRFCRTSKYGIETIESIENGCNGYLNGKQHFNCPMDYGIFVDKYAILRKLNIPMNAYGSQQLYESCLNGLAQRNQNIKHLQIKYQRVQNTLNDIRQVLSKGLNNNTDNNCTVQSLFEICNQNPPTNSKVAIKINFPSHITNGHINMVCNIDSSDNENEDEDEDDDMKQIKQNETIINIQPTLEEQIQKLEKENIVLKDKINALNESNTKFKRKLHKKFDKLKSKNNELTIILTNFILQNNDLNDNVQILKNSNNELTMNAKKLKNKSNHQNNMIFETKKENDMLSLRNNRLEIEKKYLTQQMNQLKRKVNDTENIVTNNNQLKSLNNQLKFNEKQLIYKNNRQQEIINKQNNEINQLKISNRNLSNSNNSLTMKAQELNDKYKLTTEKMIELKNRYLTIDEKENKNVMHEKKGGTVGLNNIANTCWMNSIIQCIAHVPKLVEYFGKNTLNGNISKSLKLIMNKIWNNDEQSIDDLLCKFKYEMSAIAITYSSKNYQDPAEFLEYLLNGLHNELNIASDEYANNDAIVSNGLPDNMVSILSWTAFLKSNNSPIVDLFYGQHKSSIICANEECKYNYVIFEPFKILAVSTVSKKGTLYDCIDKYVSENKLINTNWYCSKCKQDLPNSIEQIQLYKFPKVLIIHLKKLKMQNVCQQPFIDYPVNSLDLTKYDISDAKSKQIYDLFAVSCLSGHHCIAYAKNYTNNQWFCFNDSNVRKVKPNKVVVQNAYLLFYQRKD